MSNSDMPVSPPPSYIDVTIVFSIQVLQSSIQVLQSGIHSVRLE